MILLLRPQATAEEAATLVQAVRDRGLEATPLDTGKGSAFEILGADRGQILALADHPSVAGILTRRQALRGGEPFWPHVALRVAILGLLLLAAVVLLAAFLPVGLSDPPSPGLTSGEAQAEWYLRPLAAVYTILGEERETVGGVIVLVYWLLFFLLPFLDRGESNRGRATMIWRVVGAVFVLWVVVTMSGVWP